MVGVQVCPNTQTLLKMNLINSTVAIAMALLAASCASTNYEAQEEPISFDESRPINYMLTERVHGEGSAFALSPMLALPTLPGAKAPLGTGGRARNQAIGNAVWGNDNVDVVLAPKAKIKVMNFLLFETASAEVEGQGALISR
jgi:hypothetical protein